MSDDLREAAIDAAEKALGAEGFDVALESNRRIAEVALDAADAALTAVDAHRPSDPVREAAQALLDELAVCDEGKPGTFHEGFTDALTRVIAHPAAVRLRRLLDEPIAELAHPVSGHPGGDNR